MNRTPLVALLVSLVALVAASNAQANAPALPGADLPGDVDVRAVGVYEGTVPPGVPRGLREHPQGTVTINVRAVKRPVVLVLTAYEPVLWKIEGPNGAVVRVIASGYYKQAVEGLDKKVPVTYVSQEAGDADYFYAYRRPPPGPAPVVADPLDKREDQADFDNLVEQVKKRTGHEVKNLQGSYTGETFTVR